jgi:hypothetical protein
MNAYEKAQQLGMTGNDASITTQLQATGLTQSKIDLGSLLFVMNERNMLTRLVRPADTGEKWSGTVVNMILFVNANGTDDQKYAINKWFSHITGDRNSYFDTTDVSVSAPFWTMRNMFGGQQTMPSVADFDTVAALGGGWLYATLTEPQYAAQKAAAEKEAAVAAVVVKCNASREAAEAEARLAESTPTTIAAAAETAWGA